MSLKMAENTALHTEGSLSGGTSSSASRLCAVGRKHSRPEHTLTPSPFASRINHPYVPYSILIFIAQPEING